MSVFVIAEIGINHNGDLEIAKKLIDGVVFAGCDAVKFQKRTIEAVYTPEELDKPRESPFGTTNGDLKRHLEFGREEYDEIDRYCRERGIEWFASAWDSQSQLFLRKYDTKHNKIASAMLTDRDFINEVAAERKYTFISTGMSTMEEIEAAVAVFRERRCPFELMHCNSHYPMPPEEANLKTILTLKERFKCRVGYSGHEVGLIVSCAAAALGATSIERHITLNRVMFGSDQAASVEIDGLYRLVRYIRTIGSAMGDGHKTVSEAEQAVKRKLRRVDTLLTTDPTVAVST